MMSFDINNDAISDLQLKIRRQSVKLDYDMSRSFNRLFLILISLLFIYSVTTILSFVHIEGWHVNLVIDNHVLLFSAFASLLIALILYVVYRCHLLKKLKKCITLMDYYSDLTVEQLIPYSSILANSQVNQYVSQVMCQKRNLCKGELDAILNYLNKL